MDEPRLETPVVSTSLPFPSLHWPPDHHTWVLVSLDEMWRFTVIWTIIIYSLFHIGVACVALAMQVGKRKSNWKYLWMVPIVYLAIAALEAILAGSIVGLIVGGVYLSGHYPMSTWIPFIWGWTNVLVLIISSFSIRGPL